MKKTKTGAIYAAGFVWGAISLEISKRVTVAIYNKLPEKMKFKGTIDSEEVEADIEIEVEMAEDETEVEIEIKEEEQ